MERFNIYTGLLKAFEGPDNEKRFRTTASSTITDLAGDEILGPAIEKMAEKAQGNLTIFLNHEYRVPEDVLGSVEHARMETRGADSSGNPIVDLDFDIRLNQSNPRALQTWEAIKAGTKLGTSIGAIVRHAEKKKGGGLRIDDLELLEASVVGIPANPRSWVQYAMKSINTTIQNGVPEGATWLVDEETVINEAPEDIIEKAACPSCGKGKDNADCDHAYHKAGEPEVAEPEMDKEARTQVTVTVDTESTQEAPKSTPESVLADETADGDDAVLGDNVTRSEEPEVEKTVEPEEQKSEEPEEDSFNLKTADLDSLLKHVQKLLAESEEKTTALKKAESERDELKENLVTAMAIVDKIADLPIGRKTQFSGLVQDFRKKFGGIYDDEFIKFLEK